MLLSIPVASTLKALGAEYVLPELRRLARTPAPVRRRSRRPLRFPYMTQPSETPTPDGLPLGSDPKRGRLPTIVLGVIYAAWFIGLLVMSIVQVTQR
jgi:hypothetical protein